jgi:hypothetical protein
MIKINNESFTMVQGFGVPKPKKWNTSVGCGFPEEKRGLQITLGWIIGRIQL